ncbi:hypothetical protein GW796_08560 [archaeon]|nr:hypothetical protein [archaeon]
MSSHDSLKKIEGSCEPTNGITFNWRANGIGFGQMYFYLDKDDGYVHCGNEIISRSRRFLKEMLCAMVDNSVLDEPNDRHEDTGLDGKPLGYAPKPIVNHTDLKDGAFRLTWVKKDDDTGFEDFL